MPRIIRVLCFEELGFLNEPLLDTPIGKLSIRQTIIFLVFGLVGFTVFSLIPEQTIGMIVAVAVAVAGIAGFGRRVKTVSPEHILIIMLTGGDRVRKPSPKTEEAATPEAAIPEGASTADELVKPATPSGATGKVIQVSSTLDAPVKLVGMLKDPETGRALGNRAFEVFVNRERVTEGITDDGGFFMIFFAPFSYGLFMVEIKPEGMTRSQTIKVQVNPARGGA
jgi:hypothetical protein